MPWKEPQSVDMRQKKWQRGGSTQVILTHDRTAEDANQRGTNGLSDETLARMRFGNSTMVFRGKIYRVWDLIEKRNRFKGWQQAGELYFEDLQQELLELEELLRPGGF